MTLPELLEAPAILPRGDAAGDGLHRAAVERISIRGEGKAGKGELLAHKAPCPKAADRNPAAPKRDVTPGAPGAMCQALGIVLPLRPAERFSILFHQDGEDLLTDLDAEFEECVLRMGEGAEHRKRDLNGHGLQTVDELEVRGLAGMLGHGGSFVGWLPRPYHTDGEGAAALNSSVQPVLGHLRLASSS